MDITPKSETMTLELLKVLPSEIIMIILSKLPVRTIIICKCVCSSWLHLIESQAFAKLHLSTSISGLVTYRRLSGVFEVFDFEDEHNVELHDHHYNLVTKFNFPNDLWMHGSVDGFLWLSNRRAPDDTSAASIYIWVCNPITREYIRIQDSPVSPNNFQQIATYGFGSCKRTGQYKVVRILVIKSCHEQMPSLADCHIYTLGTESTWRRLAPCPPHCIPPQTTYPGVFVDGKLHWLGCDISWISCFDLETESFSTFSAPSLGVPSNHLSLELFAWGESLCLRENTFEGDKIIIWLMEEYGNVKSWGKKLVIYSSWMLGGIYRAYELHPLKVFKDGDILVEINRGVLLHYSNKTKVMQQVDMFKVDFTVSSFLREIIQAAVYTPSFRSLKSLGMGMENVISF